MNAYEKMREALIDVVKRLEARVGCDHHTFHPTATTCDGITSVGKCGNIATCAAIFKARAALAEPRRNCDVGTAEEQTERMYENYCSHHECYVIPTDAEPYGCPLYEQGVDCRLKWAQVPYEEEKGKEQ